MASAGIVEAAGYEIKITIPTEHNQLGRVICPSVIGLSAGDAQTAIEAVSLVLGTTTLSTGVVTRQNPLGGTWQLIGNNVDITLTS